MALILDALIEILRKPTVGDVVTELALFAAPLWIAVLVGLFVGWAWRPRWAAGLLGGEKAILGGRPVTSRVDSLKAQLPGSVTCSVSGKSSGSEAKMVAVCPPDAESENLAVTEEDLEHLYKLVEVTDGGPVWHKMMDRTLPNMSYQAWRRDPETGPPQYRSRTVFEDAIPEIVRDFFWDDEFRIKNGWDDMLLYHDTLKECPTTGTMVVHWIRKFPLFCSNREYIIGRRIWESGRTYYCVTKGVPCLSVPRRDKPRRVDLYYSSWCIRAVESRRGDGQLTACEVLLFHHEDMGIPWELAKLGVRQGMWGCVKRIEPGFRAYQIARRSHEPPSRCAFMAQINTKFSSDDLITSEAGTCSSSEVVEAEKHKNWADSIPKFLVIGGAVALACSLDHGLLTKAVIFGVARRFARPGRRL
ncbi:uncharacterized protein LOC103698325 [Phoenix dactylifera]|uniref:Uncharacterized protein LOC103698325 n=1 Tax=Phoenix dactylifera TaxID=42345 RepID=A0A8B7BJX9_PHODC|nr:uncharacterized protein LOC103698325 [Phoenix dactylifera]XP_008778543.2 uncharacterized protein LOC103698325 [Phoenix dactylifera]XP_026657344.2 uncharacterized protein LOC103698325 [Phoenix dactylifera]